jgi:hypothetical protein
MNRDLKNIDKLFHDNLSGAGDQPPMHVWDGIENALDLADEQKRIDKKEKRKRFAIAAFFLVAAGLTAVLWKTNEKENNAVATQINTAPVKSPENKIAEQRIIADTQGKTQQQTEKSVSAEKKEFISQSGTRSFVKVETNKKENPKTNDQLIVKQKITNDEQINNSIIASKEISDMLVADYPDQVNHLMREPENTIDIDHPDQRLSVPQILTLSTSLSPAAKKGASLVNTKRKSKFSVTAFFAPDITTRNLAQNFGVMTFSSDEKKEEILRTERNNKLDFTVGARVEYKLGNHFSLQSGISFSANTIDIAQKTVFARFDKDGALKYRFNFSSGYTYTSSTFGLLK